jgi:hypothetical protein
MQRIFHSNYIICKAVGQGKSLYFNLVYAGLSQKITTANHFHLE